MTSIVKDRILENAIDFFSKNGFHGTSMRDIATASECSLPTLYYHYKSKQDLFDEIVVNRFLQITEQMNQKIDFTAEPKELYFQVLKTRKELCGFDKEVFKMALKVWLGFEGDSSSRERIVAWETKRAAANLKIIDRAMANAALRDDVTEILINYMENIINRIILLDEEIDDDRLKKQISLIFDIGK